MGASLLAVAKSIYYLIDTVALGILVLKIVIIEYLKVAQPVSMTVLSYQSGIIIEKLLI